MLQQTQVNRVLVKYPEFLKKFPDCQKLASAPTSDVIRAWSGMGYNNRALRLQKLAKIILREHDGRLPTSVESLQNLPGIGLYTASAVACFAFNRHTAVVDTNVRRALARLFPQQARSKGEWELAQWILPKRNAYDWNQALMELGGTICTSTSPRCVSCPLKQHCPSAFRIEKIKRPVKRKERAIVPDRIYRGRIVTALLALGRRQSIEASRLAQIITADESKKTKQWLETLLAGLHRDGLIHIVCRQRKQFISLPR